MRLVSCGLTLALAMISSSASAQQLWDFSITVNATGTRSSYSTLEGTKYEPFSETFTFQRSLYPFETTTNLNSAYNSPFLDPLGLGFRFSLNGLLTLRDGQITGSGFDYYGYNFNCISSGGTAGCVDYRLFAPTFSVAYVGSPSGSAPPVPEPTTWAMMLVGFCAIGATMRRRRQALQVARV